MRFITLFFLCLPALSAEYLRIEQSFGAMDCASCAAFVEKKLSSNPGIESVKVDRKSNVVTAVLRQGNKVRLRQIRDFVEQSGFKPLEAQVVVRGTPFADRGIITLKISDSEESIRLRDPAVLMHSLITKKVEVKGRVGRVLSNGSMIDILEVQKVEIAK